MTPVLANILQPLIDIFEPVLVFFHDNVGLSWGGAIVALTISVRALLLPLTLKQVKSMRGLQLIAPEMKKLQEKYKDDRQRLNQEMMKLYSEHKVNPFASCLPLLAQLPVFIALFYLLQDDLRVEICGQSANPCGESPESSFLFIPDITDEATGAVLVTLVVLYVATQLASSLLMSVSADKNQRRIFLALPFVFVPFILSFPAGLLVYWITTNLWTIVQQFIVRKTVGPVQKPEDVAATAGKSDDEGKGGGGGLRAALRGATPAAAGSAAATTGSSGSGSGGGGGSKAAPRRSSAPPPPPSKRRKKKRSGRRR
jgi:YidC/Oxa1 family membrane protein insertase